MNSALNRNCRSEGRWMPRYGWLAVMWFAVVLVLFGTGAFLAGAFVTDVSGDDLAFRDLGIVDALSRTQWIGPDIEGHFGLPGFFTLRAPVGRTIQVPEAPWPVDSVPAPLPSTPSVSARAERAGQWWLLSDLHLGMSDDDPRSPGSVLPAFLCREVLAASGPQHVAFVGDTFELVGFAEDESLARLESILTRHPDTLWALQACAAHGVQLHFVCGNHDAELARPAVAARLAELLSPAEPTRVQVYPWFLHVPHVLVAEHGHQHHALHRMPEVLRVAVDGTDGLDLPPLAAWHADPSRSPLSRAGALVRACLASERAERRVRKLAYFELLQAESLRLALDEVAIRDLAHLSRFRTVSALPVAATRMLLAAAGRRAGRQEAPAAAGRFARTLEAHGSGVAWYVSGHTHRALEAAIDACPTRYVNTGTWSSDVRGHGPDQSDRRAFPYVVVDVARDGSTSGGLRYWRPDGA